MLHGLGGDGINLTLLSPRAAFSPVCARVSASRYYAAATTAENGRGQADARPAERTGA